MCRIAAIIGKDQFGLEKAITKMTSAMKHGGPDDCGSYVDRDVPVALGHRRLSIIDLSSAGHQPMRDLTEEYVVSFNGEIYNYEEIREKLKNKGYVFRSHSDTEVLIYGYKEWGADLLPMLKGMFAFIILDKDKKQLFAARDHAGIKPLYYGTFNSKMYFSSEVRALHSVEPDWEQDEEWPIRFYAFGFIPEPYTTLKNVFHLPKGSYLVYDIRMGTFQTYIYHQFKFRSEINTVDEAIRKTKEILLQAIQRHLIADVPVGIFLSGGIDSSLLTLLAKHFCKKQLRTLSIYFDDEKYSEKHFQDLIVEKTGVSHRSFNVSQQQFEDALPDIFDAMDQPSVDGINTYFITRYAKEYGLKVVLSGLGADELFGGYNTFNNKSYQRINRFRLPARFIASFIKKYPYRKLQFLKSDKPLCNYLYNRGLFVPKDIARMFSTSIDRVWTVLQQTGDAIQVDVNIDNQVSFIEQNLYMQNQLLRDSDIYSMWHSLELRVPFLDIDLMELAYSIDPAIKFNPSQKKFLLVQAFLEELPEPIWNRPKMGFTFPFDNWFRKSTFLRKEESSDRALQFARQRFEKGFFNWSRYWIQFVSFRFLKSLPSSATN